MKLVTIYATILATLVLALWAVAPAKAQELRGNGTIKSQNRNVSGFTGIDVGGGFRVELVLGSKEGVRLEAEENLLNNIKTEVENGVLHIYNSESIKTKKAMTAYITVKELRSIEVSGGVKVTSNSTFKADAFNVNMSGGSAVALALNTNQLTAEMSGASKLQLTGIAGKITMDMSGASKVEAAGLEATHVKIDASGASKVQVYAKETLNVSASGASLVRYKGSPKVTTDVSAAARVAKL